MLTNPQNSPKDWEKYFKDIVRLHYKPANVRDVPDKHVGDFGIECYTLNGHVFQCYLPEQVSDIAKLVAAQKKKISEDIYKFTVKNKKHLAVLFGEIVINRWILATSSNESAELIKYCAKKSIQVRELGISYIANDFEILVHTESDYSIETSFLRKENYQMNIDFNSASTESAVKWIDKNVDFLAKLDMKIPKIESNKDRVQQIRTYIIQKYLDYQNLMDILRTEWSDIHSIVFNAIQYRENSLINRFILGSGDVLPGSVIQDEMRKLNDHITEEIKTFKGTDLDTIKWGVISDWLIRCPLDF